MEIKGEVTGIIYQNEINSYTILELFNEDAGELITAVGYMPFILEGDTLKLIGKYVEHKEYGRQFKVDTFEKMMPQSLDSLERYLSNGTIKGVGPATAKKIVNKFGGETINTIKYNPIELAKIKGITEDKAIEISECFIEHWEVWQIVGFLERFNIGAENAKRVYDKLGKNAVREIENNPYILVELARNLDFKQIDNMALNLGFDKNNSKRIQSGIKYALIKITINGHSCTLLQNLEEYVSNLLDVLVEDVEENIIKLKAKGEIVIEDRKEDEQEWVYLKSFYKVEEDIARRIKLLNNAKNIKYIKNIQKELKKIEMLNDFELSEKQKEAIELVNDNNVLVITGGPGTGKTTIIKSIIEIYEKYKNKVVLCAPTGRAAKRMQETTGKEACTLHRLLEINKIDDGDIYLEDQTYQGEPIDADLIIVDEMSMVDMFLMNYLLKCIYQGTKLVLVGDSDQLPSVGPGSVLKDIIESKKVKIIHLDKIFRQAAKSKIIVNAHRVNNGKNFISKEEEKDSKADFFFIKETNQEKILQELVSLCTGRLEKFGDYNFFENIQILSPTKKGMLGTKELNITLQQYLNPFSNSKKEKSANGVIYRVGDRVMQIKNNYDIYWEKRNEKIVDGKGVFNGEIGKILNIDEQEKTVTIKFDDEKIVWYKFSELEQIEHSYAITIHKAQGSEFDVGIMVLPRTSPILLTRNLLYTGITRAKKLLIVIGSNDVISYMINNVDTKKRNTGLKNKI